MVEANEDKLNAADKEEVFREQDKPREVNSRGSFSTTEEVAAGEVVGSAGEIMTNRNEIVILQSTFVQIGS